MNSHNYAKDALRNARISSVFAWLWMIGGVLGGVGIALTTQAGSCTNDPYFGQQCNANTHPYIALGVGAALSASFFGTLILMVCNYVRMRANAHIEGSFQE